MKKTYVKPEVYFESFELSANIATGCSTITKTLNEDQQCAYHDGFEVIFLEKNSGCTTKATEDRLCYHNPHDGNKLFTS